MRTTTTVACATVLLCASSPLLGQSGNGYIGVFQDSAGTQACATVPLYTGTLLHVVAKTAGVSANGISAAEFRIEVTNPTGWYLSYTAPSGPIVLGNPLEAGVNITFDHCVMPFAGNVHLGTISVVNVGGDSTELLVKRHTTPLNPTYQCPLFVLCDTPVFSKACMTPSSEPPCAPLKMRPGPGSASADQSVFTAVLDSTASTAPGATPLSATYVPLATVQGRYGVYPPWSPTRPLFAYYTLSGLFVLDATNPTAQPLQVYQGQVGLVTWSPDGDWLLFSTPDEDSGGTLESLVAVPATGGPPLTIVERADVGHIQWGTDGNIYYWEAHAPRSHQLAPPTAWSAVHTPPFTGRPQLIKAIDPATRQERPYYFYAGSEQTAVSLSSQSSVTVGARDGFPDGRLLLRVFGPDANSDGTFIVDAQGSVIGRVGASLGEGEFSGTSVSSDGSFIAGQQVQEPDESTVYAKIYIVGSTDAWHVHLENVDWGLAPKLSRIGSFIAYTQKGGMIGVGAIQFD